MHTFEITIQRKEREHWPVIVNQSAPGQFLPMRTEGKFQLALDQLLIHPMHREYGSILGQALFSGMVKDAFLQALAASGNSLRVLLSIEDEELRSLHWQSLCAPLDNQWSHLALNQRTLFSHYLPAYTDRRFPTIARQDLRALVVVANPKGLEDYGLATFRANETIATLPTIFGSIPFDVLANTPEAVGPPTLDALCSRIIDEHYSLVHVICHGTYQQNLQETSLFLSNADGNVDRVNASRLLQRLSQLDSAIGLPHLAFFAACDTASPDAEDAFGSLAQRLVRQLGMPAVIAMTDQISLVTSQDLASIFYKKLSLYGEVDRALTEASVTLAERGDILVPALFSRLGDRPLFSQINVQPSKTEIINGISQALDLFEQRAPVLLPQVNMLAEIVQSTLKTSDARSNQSSDEYDRAMSELKQLCLDALDIDFNDLACNHQPPRYDSRCPFRGLESFQPENRDFFFGREPLVGELTERLHSERFLVLVGGSGSGKSSLALAGIAPALQESVGHLTSLIMTPGAEPLQTLKTLFSNQQTESGGTLLIVDQFEELFTQTRNEEEQREFGAKLANLVIQSQKSAVSMYVLITLRAEFIAEMVRLTELRPLVQTHQALIAPMNTHELRSAIEQQAHAVGLRFEADLVNTMIEDVKGEPGAMPLLQHTLLELWKRRHGRWLRSGEYRSIGGAKKAIATTVNNLYASLSSMDQSHMERFLLRLVRLDVGEDHRDTRRKVKLDSLIHHAGERDAFATLLDRLVAARLVMTTVKPSTGEVEVELAHEAIIEHWDRLQAWIKSDRANLLLRQRLNEDTQLWSEKQYSVDYLYRNTQLTSIIKWQTTHPDDLTSIESKFVAASQKRQRAESLRRLLTIATLVTLPVLTVLVIMSVFQLGPFAPPTIQWSAPPEGTEKQIRDIVVGDTGRIISARMDTAEIWTTDDRGDTWDAHLLKGIAIEDLAVDPQNPKLIYAIANSGGLYFSLDNGQTWKTTPDDLHQEPLTFVSVGDEHAIYVSADPSTILHSTDQGSTWNPLPNTPPITVTLLSWHETGLLVGTREGLWRWASATGWQQLLPASVGTVFGLAGDQEAIYAGTGTGLWRIQPNQIDKMTDIVVTTISSLSPSSDLYIAGTNKGSLLWWKRNQQQIEEFTFDSQSAQVFFITSLLVDPLQPDKFFVGTLTGIYRGNAQAWIEEKE